MRVVDIGNEISMERRPIVPFGRWFLQMCGNVHDIKYQIRFNPESESNIFAFM
jgi:hypothetical protein